MPIYEYKCKSCGFTFEDYRAAGHADDETNCPKCGKPKVNRVLSPFATGGAKSGGSGGGSCGPAGGGYR